MAMALMTFQAREVPSADEWQLCSLTFDDFSLDRDPMVVAGVRMFLDLGLVSKFKMDYTVSECLHSCLYMFC